MIKSSKIDSKIQRGKAKEASKLGLLFDVYRKGILYDPRIFMRPERLTQKEALEAAVSLRDIIFMDLICDATRYMPGDVFVGENPNDRYVLSFKWPAKSNVGYRCELPLTIQRPTQDEPGNDNVAPYGGQLVTTNLNLVCDPNTRVYSFTTGQAATVYASKARTGYGGQNPPSKLPLDVRESQWVFTTEIFPGAPIEINDILNFDGETYQVQAVDKQIAGFTGQILYCNLKRP